MIERAALHRERHLRVCAAADPPAAATSVVNEATSSRRDGRRASNPSTSVSIVESIQHLVIAQPAWSHDLQDLPVAGHVDPVCFIFSRNAELLA